VNTGLRNRRQWEDHETFLKGLQQIIREPSEPTIVAGDFNQKIPRQTQPRRVADLLMDTLSDYRVPTSREVDNPLIDHIAHSIHISARFLTELNDYDSSGRLSDHRGALVSATIG
jgi:endonuclease/exonuclease/phosphatase (EEP) superfamily protein YafD